MAFATENIIETLNVYLTELGRKRLLEQGFVPTSFSISDEDANYIANNTTITQKNPDLTGDHLDDVLSLSRNVVIKNQIIRSNFIGATNNTVNGTTTNITA
jgi:hypothetical protein